MEDTIELGSCTFGGREYAHGEKVCSAGKCLICNDGRWVEDKTVFVL